MKRENYDMYWPGLELSSWRTGAHDAANCVMVDIFEKLQWIAEHLKK